jgi:hypothetical protein
MAAPTTAARVKKALANSRVRSLRYTGRAPGWPANRISTPASDSGVGRLGFKAADFGTFPASRLPDQRSALRCLAAGAQARAVRHALRRAGSNPKG